MIVVNVLVMDILIIVLGLLIVKTWIVMEIVLKAQMVGMKVLEEQLIRIIVENALEGIQN